MGTRDIKNAVRIFPEYKNGESRKLFYCVHDLLKCDKLWLSTLKRVSEATNATFQLTKRDCALRS